MNREVREGFMETTAGSWRMVLILQVSTPASPSLPRLGLPVVLPQLLYSFLLNLLHWGSPWLLWHSVPTSIIHCGRCVQGQEGVERERL